MQLFGCKYTQLFGCAKFFLENFFRFLPEEIFGDAGSKFFNNVHCRLR
jgi:hypothetical protein